MEPVSRVLPRVLRELGLEQDVLGWRAVHEWARIVGPRVASRTRATACRDGILHVEVEGSAWMHELGFLKRHLIERINADLGGAHVRDVRFLASRGRASWPR